MPNPSDHPSNNLPNDSGIPALPRPSSDRELALALLERSQLTSLKQSPLPRRRLSRGERILFWALRAYAVFMLVVIAWQLLARLHGK